MADYKHGAYGLIQANASRVSEFSQCAFVLVGTAPVHLVEGGSQNVNKPMLISNIAEARKQLGFHEDFADYTLCEAMEIFFNQKGVGPLVFINVLDPTKHVQSQTATVSLTPENGQVKIVAADDVVVDTIVVKAGDVTKVKGTDYAVGYNVDKKIITISELASGSLGTSALTITFKRVDASAVTAADVIGESDGAGLNTGLFAIKNVYQMTGMIPSFLMAPGFSGVSEVHSAMVENSKKINGHWDAYILADLPIVDDDTPITLATAATWKNAHGYTQENETVYFPMAKGTDGNKYHLSVLAAANLQSLLAEMDGIPYRTASNTEAAIIENLYLGEDAEGRVYDDSLINNLLNKNGIASAVYTAGRWVIWGAHSADYSQSNADSINVSETNRMMLYYLCNDFQARRSADVDRILTANDVQSIVAEEQARLDALVQIGALLYGECHMNAEQDDFSDLVNGDFSFTFNVTTTPLTKSLTAVVNWTPDGFTTYFQSFDAEQ